MSAKVPRRRGSASSAPGIRPNAAKPFATPALRSRSWELLARTLTPKRLALLRHIHRHPATSVAALARMVGRDYKRVHEDVELLTAAGLLERSEGQIRADYDEIRAAIAL